MLAGYVPAHPSGYMFVCVLGSFTTHLSFVLYDLDPKKKKSKRPLFPQKVEDEPK